MSEMQELGKLINKTVESSLLKTQKQISDLENGYIRRNNALHEENTSLRAQVMFFEKEQQRFEETKKLNKLLKKILFWTFGSIIGLIFIVLLLLYLGWI